MKLAMDCAPSIGDVRHWERRRQEFRAAIQPWVDLKLWIVNISMPTIIIGPNFHSRTYQPDVQELLDWCDANVADEARKFGFLLA